MKTFSHAIISKFYTIVTRLLSFRSAHISQIGQIGDLKQLTFDQLKNLNTSMELTILEKTKDFYKVQVDDSSTRYILIFNSDGHFQRVEEEYWKDLDVKFKN
jgi:hypothetical protein